MSEHFRVSLRVALSALAIAALLGMAAFVYAALQPRLQKVTLGVLGEGPAQGPFGSTAQNDLSGYLAGKGYRVDLVGNPRAAGGSLVTSTMLLLMPAQSPSFVPGGDIAADPETQSQVSQGFFALERFFPTSESLLVGLEWRQYVALFPSPAGDVRDVSQGRLSAEEFWARVASGVSLAQAGTLEPVYATDFVHKDFAGEESWGVALPASVDAPPRGRLQVRLQPSTPYLPVGSDMVLVASALDASDTVAAGQALTFTYAFASDDPVVIASAVTGPGGSARVRFTPPQGAQGAALLTVGTGVGGASAAVPVVVGPMVGGAAAANAITAALALQGYNVLDARAPGPKAEQPTVLAEMVAPRFDLAVRNELLSMAGALLTLFPAEDDCAPVLLFRAGGNSYRLVFHVKREHWKDWVQGQLSEAELWGHIELEKILDAETGHPVDQRQFIAKNFAGAIDVSGPATRREVSASLTRQTWGDQPSPGRLQVPPEAYADTFSLEDRTPGTEFVIVPTTAPGSPVYASSGDPGGSKLRALRLPAGQYLLSIQGGAPPAAVRLGYVQRLLDRADTLR